MALSMLLEAAEYADQTSANPWDFAVEIDHIRSLGLSENDLRFLVRLEVVEHAHDVTVAGSKGRKFRSTGDLYFTEQTCFVLTEKGINAAHRCLSEAADENKSYPAAINIVVASEREAAPALPNWDAERRELSLGGEIVKQFKWRAVNQEMILSAFQEEGWPTRIDDPLAPSPAQSIKRRLSDTIRCLNRNQVNRWIHFRGDGTGEAVLWELTSPHNRSGTTA